MRRNDDLAGAAITDVVLTALNTLSLVAAVIVFDQHRRCRSDDIRDRPDDNLKRSATAV